MIFLKHFYNNNFPLNLKEVKLIHLSLNTDWKTEKLGYIAKWIMLWNTFTDY